MTLADVQPVREIDRLSFAIPWTDRSYHFELTENEASRLWVAEVPDEAGRPALVGMIVVWLILDEAHIGTIAVHPDHRQQGIARQLLATALLDAYQQGARKSFLEVRRGNLAAQKLYEQFGYVVVGVRPRYYRDNGEDAYLMNLEEIDRSSLESMA
jgi:ribosomal-protein-alanine N-acetyltransferase